MKYVTAILIAIMTIGTVSAAAQCRILALADEIGLTDQQREQMEKSLTAEMRERIQLKADLEKAKLDLREIMQADKIDKAAALKKSEQISAIKAEMARKRLAGNIDRLGMLNAEQRAKFEKIKGDRMERKARMRDRDCPGEGRGFGMGRGNCDRPFCRGAR